MKIIFLDVDGVLNSRSWMQGAVCQRLREQQGARYLSMLDPKAIDLLNTLVVQTEAQLVLSSTWRLLHSPREMEDLLRRVTPFSGEIIDATLSRHVPIPTPTGWRLPKLAELNSIERGFEIHDWLCKNWSNLDSFVILDDESDMCFLKHRLVQTDSNVGLTEDTILQATKMLEQPFSTAEIKLEEWKTCLQKR